MKQDEFELIENGFDPNDTLNDESTYEFTATSMLENSVKMYMKSVSEIPRLTKEEEKEIYKRISQGDESARNILVERNIRLVISLAKHYNNPGLNFEDIIQEGNFGLITASQRFDPTRGFKFSTYATYWIRQSIGRAIASKTSIIKLSPSHRDLIKKASRAENLLTSKLGRKPTSEEVAEYIGEPLEKIKHAYTSVPSIGSIDAKLGDSDDGSTIADIIEDDQTILPEDRAILLDRREHLNAVLSTLTEFEEKVVRLRYGLDDEIQLTVKDIAKRYGFTPAHISNVEKRAIQKLRRPERAAKLQEFMLEEK